MKNKKPIPVIGVPIVNGVKWLERLIKSIDYPVNNLLIINNNGKGEIDLDLDNLKKINNRFVKKLNIIHLPSNLGVASSWNLIIKLYLMESYWVISNHDVAFTPGLLKEIADATEDKSISIIHPHAANFNLGSYDLFAITENGVKEIGLFDENLYPAYGEDSDFIMRCQNINTKKILGLSRIHIHGNDIAKADDEHYKKNAQQTKKENPLLVNKLEEVNFINFEYLNKKWGDGWRWCDPFKNPFENKNYPNTYTTWDLEYVRKKYLGF